MYRLGNQPASIQWQRRGKQQRKRRHVFAEGCGTRKIARGTGGDPVRTRFQTLAVTTRLIMGAVRGSISLTHSSASWGFEGQCRSECRFIFGKTANALLLSPRRHAVPGIQVKRTCRANGIDRRPEEERHLKEQTSFHSCCSAWLFHSRCQELRSHPLHLASIWPAPPVQIAMVDILGYCCRLMSQYYRTACFRGETICTWWAEQTSPRRTGSHFHRIPEASPRGCGSRTRPPSPPRSRRRLTPRIQMRSSPSLQTPSAKERASYTCQSRSAQGASSNGFSYKLSMTVCKTI